MNNGIISFGNIPDLNKKKILDIICDVYIVFNESPHTFIISGGKHSGKPTTKNLFENSLIKNGYSGIYMVDAMIITNNEIASYISVFFCNEKSHIKFACSKNIDLQLAIEFWKATINYIDIVYGFSMGNLPYNPILYSTGTHIYNFGFIDNLVKKEQIQKEKYWIHNSSESRNGLLRDIYKINILNEKQLNLPIVDSITLRDYINLHKVGELLPFRNDLHVWNLNDSDMVEADELKNICNENTILNAPKWKFK